MTNPTKPTREALLAAWYAWEPRPKELEHIPLVPPDEREPWQEAFMKSLERVLTLDRQRVARGEL